MPVIARFYGIVIKVYFRCMAYRISMRSMESVTVFVVKTLERIEGDQLQSTAHDRRMGRAVQKRA